MGNIDKNTKSLEILGEVPVRMVETSMSKSDAEGMLPQPPQVLRGNLEYREPVIKEPNPSSYETPPLSKDPQSKSGPLHFHSHVAALPPVSTVNVVSAHLGTATPVSRTLSESSAVAALTELASQGRTTQDIMNARTLLSLHGPGSTTPSSSLVRAKKNPRKQKPVASARASPSTGNSAKDSTLPPPQSGKNVEQLGSVLDNGKPKKKDYTPEELLKILDIPTSSMKASSDSTPQTKGGAKSQVAPAKRDEEAGDSNEGTESSESSSESDSAESEEDEKAGQPSMLTRVKGRGVSQSSSESSSSSNSSSDEEDGEVETRPQKALLSSRVGQGGRSRGGGAQVPRPTQKTHGITRSVRGRVQKPQVGGTTKVQRFGNQKKVSFSFFFLTLERPPLVPKPRGLDSPKMPSLLGVSRRLLGVVPKAELLR